MTGHEDASGIDRRADVRLASGKLVKAVVLDDHAQPTTVLGVLQVDNVSAGGLALVGSDAVDPGARVEVRIADTLGDHDAAGGPLGLRAVDCTPCGNGRHKIGFKLVAGHMPASLLYDW